MSAAGSMADSLMEPAGEAGRVRAPGLRDGVSTNTWERALTHRGDSASSSDESEPGSRRVSFADAFGLELVSVKEFSSRDSSTPTSAADALDANSQDSEEYFLCSLFSVPASAAELLGKLEEQKCELECIEFLPGTTSLRGIIRVLNLCYDKTVYVRTSLDSWNSHFDILAEFIPGSSDGETDRFTFNLTLVPPFQQEGARVEFCLRYETSYGTFWANNNGMNYVLFCHQRGGRDGKGRQHEDTSHRSKKSCLKPISKDKSTEANQTVISAETADTPNHKQEVVVHMPIPQSEGLQEDSWQKSLGESGRNSSRRNRRRAARLARIRDEETRRRAFDLRTPAPERGPSHPRGICDRNQTNSEERTPMHEQITLPSPQADRGGSPLFLTERTDARKGTTWDIPCENRQDSTDPSMDMVHTAGWDSTEAFVHAGETQATACARAEGEGAPQGTLWDTEASQGVFRGTAVPQGALWNTAAPQGALRSTAAPQGAVWETAAPQGALWDTATPQGNLWDTAALQGAFRGTAAPQGALRSTVAPKGALWDTAASRSALWDTAAPQGALWGTAALQGALGGTAVRRGVFWDTAAPKGALWDTAAPQGALEGTAASLSGPGRVLPVAYENNNNTQVREEDMSVLKHAVADVTISMQENAVPDVTTNMQELAIADVTTGMQELAVAGVTMSMQQLTVTHGTDGKDRDQQHSLPNCRDSARMDTMSDSRDRDPLWPQSDRFKFDTFVAPLYHQASGRMGPERQDVTGGVQAGDQASEESDDESQMSSTAHSNSLTGMADAWPLFPFGSYVLPVNQLGGSGKTLESAPEDSLNGMPSLQETRSLEADIISHESVQQEAECGAEVISHDGVHSATEYGRQHKESTCSHGEHLFTTKAAEGIQLWEAETKTKSTDMTATIVPLKSNIADGFSVGDCNRIALLPPFANVKTENNGDELEENHMKFTLSFSEREEHVTVGEAVREKEEQIEEPCIGITDNNGKKSGILTENEKDLTHEGKEVLLTKKQVNIDEDKEKVSPENENKLNKKEDVSVQNKDLYGKNLTENEDLDEMEVSVEDEDVDEEVSVENEDFDNLLFDNEVTVGDELYEAKSMENENNIDGVAEEVAPVIKHLDEEELEMSAGEDEDLYDEEEDVLIEMTKEFHNGENGLPREREDVDDGMEEVFRTQERSPCEKSKADALAGQDVDLQRGRETEGDVDEGVEVSEDTEKDCRNEGEHLRKVNPDQEAEEDSTSTDSLTDDEMELHMHSVKSAHEQQLAHATPGKGRATPCILSKRPSVSMARTLPTLLSSISESLDEDGEAGEEIGVLPEDHVPIEKPEDRGTIILPPTEKAENIAGSYMSLWEELFSWGHLSRAFLYILLCVVFFVTAYHYDFLACFALYLFSMYWLCFHGEKKRSQAANRTE